MGKTTREALIFTPGISGQPRDVSSYQISSFPVLHIANKHVTGHDTTDLGLSPQLPIVSKRTQHAVQEQVSDALTVPDNQGSFDKLSYRLMLEAENKVGLLKGCLLVEGIISRLPSAHSSTESQADQSAVYPLLAEAIVRLEDLRRGNAKIQGDLRRIGKDGEYIGKMFGVGQVEVPPSEIKQHPEIGEAALNILGINRSIFEKRTKDERDHIANSRYRRSMRAVETIEERERIDLAMEVACDFFGLKQTNVVSNY